GDDACAACHPTHADSYRQHPMGRSLIPLVQDTPVETFDEAAHNPFERLNTQFLVECRSGAMVHKARTGDAQGQVVADDAADVQSALGSGTRGRSYLINREGYLFLSPVSWYSQQKVWDLTPGMAGVYPRQRIVDVICLFCHVNHAEAVAHTRNRFAEPI